MALVSESNWPMTLGSVSFFECSGSYSLISSADRVSLHSSLSVSRTKMRARTSSDGFHWVIVGGIGFAAPM